MSELQMFSCGNKRKLQLMSFSSLIDALRAGGALTQEKKALLQLTVNSLTISSERYKAEIRRAVAKARSYSDIDDTPWAMEGRRDTFLLPRNPSRSTWAAPYAAYTPKMVPALVKLPKAPCKSVETQTVTPPKPIVNPKLVVVSSPRTQTTPTVVYANPSGQRQVRINSQTIGKTIPVVVNSKGQAKLVSMPTVVKPTVASMTPVNAQKTSQHLVVSSSANQHSKQIVITTPNNIVHKISAHGATQTLQVRPSTGTAVVTKLLNTNRTGELKVIQRPRVAQIRALGAPVATLTPVGVRLTQSNGRSPQSSSSTSSDSAGPPPTKIMKAASQWNYDDHSVMAKPPGVAPSSTSVEAMGISVGGGDESTERKSSASNCVPVSSAASSANPQTKTVQIVQMSTSAQNSHGTTTVAVAASSSPRHATRPVRMVTPTPIMQRARDSSRAASVASNVVVQSLPYQNYQGSIYKMVPEDVILEEEVV
ncbi:BRCA2-interacting transcriptional repressor EMSY [Galendromus occidentalis]|uniref:BRCA2-interacting transcriptional repressor EMSY n=1 Tax=Galendromus occidentalis TaxID=34638 RepID=A0AAJ7PAF9_9ACAR|nr:BRCA2-interacting transcriptional repressor EMSY [Galendromus occidentalis]